MYLLATVALIAWILVLLVVAEPEHRTGVTSAGARRHAGYGIVLICLFPLVGLLVYYLTLGRSTATDGSR